MSANGTRMTIARQWEVLKLLPSRAPGHTVKEITQRLEAEGFSISKRSVERDLVELSRIFPIVCNDKSKPFGWYWSKDAIVDLPGLSLAESLSLTLIEGTVKSLLPPSVLEAITPRFQQAHAHLDALEKEHKLATWREKVAVVTQMLPQQSPAVANEVLEQVQFGLLHERCLQVDYRSLKSDFDKSLMLHPLGLVQRGSVTYLVARVNDYEDIRQFALHRMSRVEVLETARELPAGFELSQYIQNGAFHYSNGQTLALRLKVYSEEVARNLQESPLASDQELNAQESAVEVTATTEDSWQLRWWLLSFGELVEVIEPLTLRTELAERLQKAGLNYQS